MRHGTIYLPLAVGSWELNEAPWNGGKGRHDRVGGGTSRLPARVSQVERHASSRLTSPATHDLINKS